MIFQDYAKYYDLIYMDKDYEKECDFLEEIFHRFLKLKPKTILDLGCGTGGHAIPLVRRGYRVVGIDVSEAMISLAREKATKAGTNIRFYVMDARDFRLNVTFDACISMFSVIDYLTTDDDLSKTLKNVRTHLKKGSLFIFDFWYGPAVLTILPSKKVKIVEREGKKVVRIAKPHLNALRHICEVDYRIVVTQGSKVIDEANEKHLIRFYFSQELKHHLKESRFKMLKFCSFLNLDKDANERVWDAVGIAMAE